MTFIHQPTEIEKKQQDKDFIERLKLFCEENFEEKPKIMSKQTAMTLFVNDTLKGEVKEVSYYLEMEKQQIENTWITACEYCLSFIEKKTSKGSEEAFKQFYNKTFKN